MVRQINHRSRAAKFEMGEHVRIKGGVTDPDCPEMVIGGWGGVIAGVREGPPAAYLVHWSPSTVEIIHPCYRRRRERSGVDVDQIWLSGDDLIEDRDVSEDIEKWRNLGSMPLPPAHAQPEVVQ